VRRIMNRHERQIHGQTLSQLIEGSGKWGRRFREENDRGCRKGVKILDQT